MTLCSGNHSGEFLPKINKYRNNHTYLNFVFLKGTKTFLNTCRLGQFSFTKLFGQSGKNQRIEFMSLSYSLNLNSWKVDNLLNAWMKSRFIQIFAFNTKQRIRDGQNTCYLSHVFQLHRFSRCWKLGKNGQ